MYTNQIHPSVRTKQVSSYSSLSSSGCIATSGSPSAPIRYYQPDPEAIYHPAVYNFDPMPTMPQWSTPRPSSPIAPPAGYTLRPYVAPKYQSPTCEHVPQFQLERHLMPALYFPAAWSVEYKLASRGLRAGVDMHKFKREGLIGADDNVSGLLGGKKDIDLVINWPGYAQYRQVFRIHVPQTMTRYDLAKEICRRYRSFFDSIIASQAVGLVKRFRIGPDGTCGESLIEYANLFVVGIVCVSLDPPLWSAEVAADGVY